MKLPWFKRAGIIFIPDRFCGWIIFIAAALYAIYKFIDIDGRSHSVSDTLINFVFYLIIIGMVYSAIGYFTSKPRNEKQNS